MALYSAPMFDHALGPNCLSASMFSRPITLLFLWKIQALLQHALIMTSVGMMVGWVKYFCLINTVLQLFQLWSFWYKLCVLYNVLVMIQGTINLISALSMSFILCLPYALVPYTLMVQQSSHCSQIVHTNMHTQKNWAQHWLAKVSSR